MSMSGPILNEGPSVFRCWVGFACEIAVTGQGLSSQNRLLVAEGACNSTNRSLMSLSGLSSLATSSSGTAYALGTAMEASFTTFVVCWLATESAAGIDFGTLSVFGPVEGTQGTHVTCRLNETCSITLDSMVGSLGDGFDQQSYLQLEKGGSCSGSPATVWGNLTNPVPQSPLENATSLTFDLLVPSAQEVAETDLVVGNYSLCLSLNGTGPFSMAVGSLIVEDVPCEVPSDILDTLEPACLSSDSGLPAAASEEFCLVALEGGPQATLSRLQVVPAGQESCQGLQHGSQCDLNCPAGTLASGYFLCEHGIFYHQGFKGLLVLS
ncbi:unnamed protein product [Symbiodinium natans]|uniref:Uncharacterized protein n=1 Tax=Symbiodinium natans TaxID=878477 RepID=A0A812KKV6_9DINO|nr:unnamed protein product [Symbiodinium natans]